MPEERQQFFQTQRPLTMKRTVTLAALLLLASGSAALAASPETIAQAASSCCEMMAACCEMLAACC